MAKVSHYIVHTLTISTHSSHLICQNRKKVEYYCRKDIYIYVYNKSFRSARCCCGCCCRCCRCHVPVKNTNLHVRAHLSGINDHPAALLSGRFARSPCTRSNPAPRSHANLHTHIIIIIVAVAVVVATLARPCA